MQKSKFSARPVLQILLFCLLSVVQCRAVFANEALSTTSTSGVSEAQTTIVAAPLIDKEDLRIFVDGVVNTAMQDHDIAGAVVAVVSRDDTLLLEGYGLANAESGEAVDPAKHLFRIASISKLFTATAIMQLVEDGQIDLDSDIRTYLGELGFDDRQGTITVSHLLTHTPGFEDRVLGYFGANPKLEGKPRNEQFEALAPRQVRAPGELTSYSNYGFALLGEIVARVSGKSYAQYINDEIFARLGMNRSATSIRSFRAGEGDAKVESLRPDEARGHGWRNGWYAPLTFPETLDLLEPEGSIASTAQDMVRFMRAHLNQGSLDDQTVLAAETAGRMHETLFTHMPGVNGNAHGFWVLNVGGHRALEHGGSINNFRSALVLVPELGLGVFVSTNTESGGRLGRLPERIIEQFFPKAEIPTRQAGAVSQDRLSDFTGRYIGARRVQSRVGKIANLTNVLNIDKTEEGDLSVWGEFGSDRYVPIGGERFRSLGNGEIMAFDAPDGERAEYVFFSGSAHNGYERVAFSDEPLTFYGPVFLAVAVSLAVLFGYGVRLVGFAPRRAPDIGGWERLAVVVASVASLLLVLQSVRTFSSLLGDETAFYAAFPTPGFVGIYALVWCVAIAALVVAALIPRVLTARRRTPIGKARYVAFAAILISLVWSMVHWNFLTL